MKKIGIVGGLSVESTLEYYKIIVKEYQKIKGDFSSPLIVIDSLNLKPVSELMAEDDWDSVFDILKNSFQNIVSAGAEVGLLATNTPHMVFDRLAESITIPLISIMEATAQAIRKQSLTKVGLLGTRFTMTKGFYQKALTAYDISVVVPDNSNRKIIDQIIWQELVLHKITRESKKKYLQIIAKLVNQGAQGIILGCTEIPLLIKQNDCSIPVFDTTTIHAKAILDYAMNKK
jgi:aspartate racemase